MENKLHITIVDYVGIKAGLDLYNDELATALIDQSVHVKVLSNYRSKFGRKYFSNKFANSPGFFSWLFLGYVKSLIAIKIKSDVVIVHLFNPTILDSLFLKCIKRWRKKIVCILHDVESLTVANKENRNLEKCLNYSDHLVVHNNFTFKLTQQKFPRFAFKLVVIPHISFHDQRTIISKQDARYKLSLPLDKDIILFFGMIKQSKGLDVLLLAMSNVDANLVIAGRLRNQIFNNYSEIIEKNNIADKVISDINYIRNEKRDLYFKAADLIVLPYRKIYQSGVLILALSYELPVVMSNLQPNIEFLGDSKCVVLFESEDSIDLADKVNSVLTDRMRLKDLIEQGKIKLARDHNPAIIAKSFLELIER